MMSSKRIIPTKTQWSSTSSIAFVTLTILGIVLLLLLFTLGTDLISNNNEINTNSHKSSSISNNVHHRNAKINSNSKDIDVNSDDDYNHKSVRSNDNILTSIDWDCSVPSISTNDSTTTTTTPTTKGDNDKAGTDDEDQKQQQQEPKQCPRTGIFPFMVGCPTVCNRTDRTGSNITNTTIDIVPLYSIGVAWYFGQPPSAFVIMNTSKNMNTSTSWKDNNNNNNNTNNTTDSIDKYNYDGKTYQSIPESFAQQFSSVAASIQEMANEQLLPKHKTNNTRRQQQELQKQKQGMTTTRSISEDKNSKAENNSSSFLQYHIQTVIHISLSYLCCLTEDEVFRAKEYINEWIMKQYPFDIPITFDHIECYHERYNSVTTILVLDNESQLRLMYYNHNLNQYLQKRNVPVPIVREQQMKFHTTIIGLNYSPDPYGGLQLVPENDISKNLSTIQNIISTINNNNKNNLVNNNSNRSSSSSNANDSFYVQGIRIQHAPKVYSHCHAEVHATS